MGFKPLKACSIVQKAGFFMENIGKRLLEFCCDEVQSVPGHSSISELCMVHKT